MKMKPLLVLSLLSAALLTQTGCLLLVAGAAAGAGTYAYVDGELKASQPESLDKTFAAAQGAVKDLEFSVTKTEKDAVSAHLTAKTAQDKTVDISLKRISDNTTEIRIRVGTFGDKSLSDLILEKIRSRL
jgi:hypothetical protein